MARPTDWWILFLDKDPLPQDPDNLHLWSTLYHDFADQVDLVRGGTVGLMGDPAVTGWLGRSGQAFIDAMTGVSGPGANMITDANVGRFLTERHPDFAPLYQSHLDDWGTDPSMRYFLLQLFAREFMVPLLRTGTTEQRTALFESIERLLADGDPLIEDAVDNEIIDELVYVGYALKDDPVDLTGTGPLTTGRIDRTRTWRPGKP